ncbi:hypothetical protein HRbin07_00719 [bacterium HR07]|nr:hypothetical protein HRbin07_00719 [bacterium HR07]
MPYAGDCYGLCEVCCRAVVVGDAQRHVEIPGKLKDTTGFWLGGRLVECPVAVEIPLVAHDLPVGIRRLARVKADSIFKLWRLGRETERRDRGLVDFIDRERHCWDILFLKLVFRVAILDHGSSAKLYRPARSCSDLERDRSRLAGDDDREIPLQDRRALGATADLCRLERALKDYLFGQRDAQPHKTRHRLTAELLENPLVDLGIIASKERSSRSLRDLTKRCPVHGAAEAHSVDGDLILSGALRLWEGRAPHEAVAVGGQHNRFQRFWATMRCQFVNREREGLAQGSLLPRLRCVNNLISLRAIRRERQEHLRCFGKPDDRYLIVLVEMVQKLFADLLHRGEIDARRTIEQEDNIYGFFWRRQPAQQNLDRCRIRGLRAALGEDRRGVYDLLDLQFERLRN